MEVAIVDDVFLNATDYIGSEGLSPPTLLLQLRGGSLLAPNIISAEI